MPLDELLPSTASTSVILIVPVLLACGCSSGGGGGNSAPPTCQSNTVQIEGSLDGAEAKGNYGAPFSYAFEQTGTGTLTVDFTGNGELDFAWSKIVPDEQSTPITGTITLPAQGPHAGQAYCVTAGSMTRHSLSSGTGVSFSITSLAQGACPGTPVSGSLEGCSAD
jgi:hypothetical protein